MPLRALPRVVDDGDRLLDPAIDLEWLIDTSAILAAAETYLLIPPHRLGPRRLPGLARDHRSSPGPGRGREFLTTPAWVLTWGYDTETLSRPQINAYAMWLKSQNVIPLIPFRDTYVKLDDC